MQRDERTYIRLHDGMPDHPKVEGLSDKAFRLLIETWCWSSRHLTDGHVRAAVWTKRGTAAARRELIAEGLAEPVADGVQMHDYPEHQRTKAEVEQRQAVRREAGAQGNHRRWHEGRGVVDPGCPHCVAPASQRPSQVRSQDDRETSPEVETEKEIPTTDVVGAPPTLIDVSPPPAEPVVGAQALVAEWLDHCTTRPPSRVIGQASRELKILLEDGIPPSAVRAGLARWHERRLHPSALASVVHEVRSGPAVRASTTDQRVGAALDLAGRLREQEAQAAGAGK